MDRPGGGSRRAGPRSCRCRPVSPRLISVLVTGDELDGFADAAPTSHLKVFLPAEGQDAPNLPTPGPDGTPVAPDGPAAGGPHLHAAPLRPGHAHPRDPVPAARDRPRLGVGAAGQAGRQARGGRPRRPVLPRAGAGLTGGSPPTSPPSRPSARCSRRCRRRPPPTSTSRSTARTTRSSSPARPRPRSPGTTGAAPTRSAPSWPTPPARRPSPTAPASGWPARPPRCATSAATSSPTRHLPPGVAGHPGLLAHRRAEPPRPRLRRGLSSPVSYWPTRPSIRSLSRSAWPQWRAYSSIMWTRTSRSEIVLPSAWCRGCRGRRRRRRSARRRRPRPASHPRPRRPPRDRPPRRSSRHRRSLVGPVQRGSVLARHHPPEPVPLHVGHVTDQAEQGHRGRRHRPARQLARRRDPRTSSPSSAGRHAGSRGEWTARRWPVPVVARIVGRIHPHVRVLCSGRPPLRDGSACALLSHGPHPVTRSPPRHRVFRPALPRGLHRLPSRCGPVAHRPTSSGLVAPRPEQTRACGPQG